MAYWEAKGRPAGLAETCVAVSHGLTDELIGVLQPGVYRLHWTGGMSSVASVGQDSTGRTWYAPANWVTVPWYDWSKVASVELIEPSFPPDTPAVVETSPDA